jgi:hypothetical protein
MRSQAETEAVAETGEQKQEPQYMDNPSAVGAPKNWRWGYLPCGCHNDGYGRHVR